MSHFVPFSFSCLLLVKKGYIKRGQNREEAMKRYLMVAVASVLLSGCETPGHPGFFTDMVQESRARAAHENQAARLAEEESIRQTKLKRERDTQWDKDHHICSSYNPDACYTPAQKRQQAIAEQQMVDAVTCSYGDFAACNRYPGGASAAAAHARQMKLEACLRSFSTLPGTRDYYGTEHLACR